MSECLYGDGDECGGTALDGGTLCLRHTLSGDAPGRAELADLRERVARLEATHRDWGEALRRLSSVECGPDCQRPECVHGAMVNHEAPHE